MSGDCDRCGRPASLRLTEVVGGVKRSVPLCNECAMSEGVVMSTTSEAIEIDGETDSLLSALPRTCPECGTSDRALRKTGRVGCPECYVTFREILRPLLRRVHGCTDHHPAESRRDPRRAVSEDLRSRMLRAIADEDFETAARLRDELDRMGDTGEEGSV